MFGNLVFYPFLRTMKQSRGNLCIFLQNYLISILRGRTTNLPTSCFAKFVLCRGFLLKTRKSLFYRVSFLCPCGSDLSFNHKRISEKLLCEDAYTLFVLSQCGFNKFKELTIVLFHFCCCVSWQCIHFLFFYLRGKVSANLKVARVT